MRVLADFEQRSEQWYAIRNGRITMSNAKALLTKGNGLTRLSYLREVAAEILAGPPDDRCVSHDMARGMELEPFAIQAYRARTRTEVQQVGFVLAEDERIGCSPDGLVPPSGTALEIKCPLPKHHLRYMDRKQVETDHGPQMQGEMWVCEVDCCDFVSFCPWVKDAPLIVHTFHRDEATIKALADSAHRGADEVEQMVLAVRDGYGCDDFIRNIAGAAAQHWDSYAAMSDEVNLNE